MRAILNYGIAICPVCGTPIGEDDVYSVNCHEVYEKERVAVDTSFINVDLWCSKCNMPLDWRLQVSSGEVHFDEEMYQKVLKNYEKQNGILND